MANISDPETLEREFAERAKHILPRIAESERTAAIEQIMTEYQNRKAMAMTPAQRIRNAAYDPSRDRPSSPSDYLQSFGAQCDALKSVMEFLAAQQNMDIFSGNKDAQRIYDNIIQHGLAVVFSFEGKNQ